MIAIQTQLQSKRIVNAKNIAEKHNVSTRTVFRDIQTLEKSGIPVVTKVGKGYSVMEAYN
ncbi:helix-turn-helix transcriptional regulator [Polaribacter reichenbachii]|uniref:helix-turn-helix transcriptional regulator n=1 Tax=Polaribacter reichenbachii TaxID=996801 RepID=UPI001F48BD5F|nr:helix-turn-helix domain-containing protein [Polaribacter reichenbachii]